MMEVNAITLSQRLWAYLNLNLQSDAEAMLVFNNVPALNGAEAWRRLVVPINSRTVNTRHQMYRKVHTPNRASKLLDLMRALEEWETSLRTYYEAGGQELSQEDMCTIARNIVPSDMTVWCMSALRPFSEYSILK